MTASQPRTARRAVSRSVRSPVIVAYVPGGWWRDGTRSKITGSSPAFGERVEDVRADEAGAAGDEDSHASASAADGTEAGW